MCAMEKIKKVFTNLGEVYILRKDKTTQKQFEKNPKRAIEYIAFRHCEQREIGDFVWIQV